MGAFYWGRNLKTRVISSS